MCNAQERNHILASVCVCKRERERERESACSVCVGLMVGTANTTMRERERLLGKKGTSRTHRGWEILPLLLGTDDAGKCGIFWKISELSRAQRKWRQSPNGSDAALPKDCAGFSLYAVPERVHVYHRKYCWKKDSQSEVRQQSVATP